MDKGLKAKPLNRAVFVVTQAVVILWEQVASKGGVGHSNLQLRVYAVGEKKT